MANVKTCIILRALHFAKKRISSGREKGFETKTENEAVWQVARWTKTGDECGGIVAHFHKECRLKTTESQDGLGEIAHFLYIIFIIISISYFIKN